MAIDHHIIHWNCRGLRKNYHEIELLISEFSPDVICLQETMLTPNINPSFKNYTCYYESQSNGSHGLGTLVKKSIPQSRINLVSPLEVIAINVTIQGKTYTISNHYVSPSDVLSKEAFNKVIKEFKFPYLLCGDFNAHNPLWSFNESVQNDVRGRVIEELLNDHSLILLNSTIKTRYQMNCLPSLLDLVLVHPLIYLDLNYKLFNSIQFNSSFIASIHHRNTLTAQYTINKLGWDNEGNEASLWVPP